MHANIRALSCAITAFTALLGCGSEEGSSDSDTDSATSGSTGPAVTTAAMSGTTGAADSSSGGGTTTAASTGSESTDGTTTAGATGDTTEGTTDGSTDGTTGSELCEDTVGSTGYVGGPTPDPPLEAYLKPDIADSSQEFGRWLAFDDDTVVACSNTYEIDDSETGAAFVYVRDEDDQWLLQDILVPPETDRDLFCSSVAIQGDTIVVGAPEEDGDGSDPANNDVSNSGAAYVYTRCGWDWELEAYLKPAVIESSDEFGISVAIDGDRIVVGTPLEDSSATGVDGDASNNDTQSAGAAYVFERSGETWSQTAYLKASHVDGAAFGTSVAVSGTTVAVGAPSEDGSGVGIDPPFVLDGTGLSSGAVFVFEFEGGSWSQQAYIKASNSAGNATFGHVVDIDGDTLAVGSPGESGTSTGVNGDQSTFGFSPGAAYVLVRNGGVWSQQAYVKATNTGSNDQFGVSVALDGDTLIVGAPQEDSNSTTFNLGGDNDMANGAGAAYTYTRSMGAWSVGDYVKAPNASAADLFGTAVGVAADTIAVGAPFEDSDATGVNGDLDNDNAGNNGAVYVFVP